jgi:hypothetical protein
MHSFHFPGSRQGCLGTVLVTRRTQSSTEPIVWRDCTVMHGNVNLPFAALLIIFGPCICVWSVLCFAAPRCASAWSGWQRATLGPSPKHCEFGLALGPSAVGPLWIPGKSVVSA